MGRCATENDDLSDFESVAATTSVQDIADYIAELSDELAGMARTNRLTLLAALFQLASVEARKTATSHEFHSNGILHSGSDRKVRPGTEFKIEK